MELVTHRSEISLGHVPQGARWEFDESVARVFTDMVKRSIPQYDTMRKAVFEIGKRYVSPGSYVIDLGSSAGDSLAPFVGHFGASNRYVGVEVSEPMLNILHKRFAEEIAAGVVDIQDGDLREEHPVGQASLTLLILTLQFIPVNHRQRILRNIYQHTQPGGALIFVEKILGSTANLNDLAVDIYHDYKEEMGYSRYEIEKKRAALENALVPLTSRWNEELLISAGFTEVDCFWRWMNFAGYIAIKR
jgi:tRNA (cmo5U34)-methyltransferase